MKPISLKKIKDACKGALYGDPALLAKNVCGVRIDDRKVEQGDLFVPIIGEKFDGHDFIERAMAAGAVCTLSDRELPEEIPHIRVKDTLAAYQRIAASYKSLFDVPTVGITGSAGKTTTKEMIASVLSAAFKVLKTQGNLNNQTGVPQNLLRLDDSHTAAVIEMGTNHFGEIAALSTIVAPDFCFITNIGDAHIEHLKSKEGILRAKLEILEGIKEGGRLYVNGDDPMLAPLRETHGAVTFGLSDQNDVYAENIRQSGLKGISFRARYPGDSGGFNVFVHAPGEHMAANALAGIAAGLAMGMREEDIARGVESYRPPEGRMNRTVLSGITIIDDSYNANPAAVKAAVNVLVKAEGNTVAVLGDMFELGEKSEAYHREIGEYAARKVDEICCIGDQSRFTVEAARNAGGSARHFGAPEDLLKYLAGHLKAGDTVLIKGSHGMRLDRTVRALIRHFTEQTT